MICKWLLYGGKDVKTFTKSMKEIVKMPENITDSPFTVF